MENAKTSTSDTQVTQQCCLGALYYSQAFSERNKQPICLGISHKPGQAVQLDERTQLGDGFTDFKFICIGHSVYDKTKQASAEGSPGKSGSHGKPQHTLPYCEGFEVIMAGQVEDPATQQRRHGAGIATTSSAAAPSSSAAPNSSQDSRPPSALGALFGGDGTSAGKFAARFMKVAERNVAQMKSSINQAYSVTIKAFIDKLSDE
eukprot:jgi/Chrzof1/9130/Cz03g37020.t1